MKKNTLEQFESNTILTQRDVLDTISVSRYKYNSCRHDLSLFYYSKAHFSMKVTCGHMRVLNMNTKWMDKTLQNPQRPVCVHVTAITDDENLDGDSKLYTSVITEILKITLLFHGFKLTLISSGL